MPLSPIRSTALLLGAFLLAPLAPAQAQSAGLTCVGSGASVSCAGHVGAPGDFPQITHVRAPNTDRELAEAADRDRKWRARCEPIIRHDLNGVRRYLYTAPGCDVGRYED